jgi:predicted nucleic acid-binding protein
VVRRGVAKSRPAPWSSLVLDSEGLWAVARNDSEAARAALSASRTAGVPVVVPSVVLAETLYGDERDARANQALKNLVVCPTTELIARLAALCKRQSAMRGVKATIDAIVVATSVDLGGGAILTSDAGDIDRIAASFGDPRVKAISV